MSIRCKTRAANGSGLVATNKSHPCTERVPRRHVPAHAETHAHVQVCEIFSCFCSWGGQGPCMRLRLHVTRRQLAHEGDEVLEDRMVFFSLLFV